MILTTDGTELTEAHDEGSGQSEPSEVEAVSIEALEPGLKAQPEAETESRAVRPNFLTATRFSDFDLPQEIMDGLDTAGFECCTPIQAQAIPVALAGQDIAGQAQTGTGKTTAFLVPVMARLLKKPPVVPGMPRAIIVTPTRELALQIYNDAKLLAGNSSLTQALVIGGMEYREQAALLEAGPDIVICTPGRIIDYLYQGVFQTKAIEVAVVDEADRLLDMGFIKDLKILLGKLPSFTHRQTMLFSATLDDRVLELTYQYMNPPQYITAEPDAASKIQINQLLYHVSHKEKLPLLLGFLKKEEHSRVIIFCNTKSGVEWLAKKLTLNGYQAEGITGDLPQPKRLKLMESFKEKKLQIMVATDVASRGIHVEDVSHVYNYDLPQDAENYIHRIGRTARAGKTGKAVSFACEDHVFHLDAIENLLGEKIPVAWADDDSFEADKAGDVRVKGKERERERDRGDRRPRSGKFGGSERPHESSGGTGGSGGEEKYRGPGRSTRPGGIFGLSPRFLPTEGQEDSRRQVSWNPVEVGIGPVPVPREKRPDARQVAEAYQASLAAQTQSAQDLADKGIKKELSGEQARPIEIPGADSGASAFEERLSDRTIEERHESAGRSEELLADEILAEVFQQNTSQIQDESGEKQAVATETRVAEELPGDLRERDRRRKHRGPLREGQAGTANAEGPVVSGSGSGEIRSAWDVATEHERAQAKALAEKAGTSVVTAPDFGTNPDVVEKEPETKAAEETSPVVPAVLVKPDVHRSEEFEEVFDNGRQQKKVAKKATGVGKVAKEPKDSTESKVAEPKASRVSKEAKELKEPKVSKKEVAKATEKPAEVKPLATEPQARKATAKKAPAATKMVSAKKAPAKADLPKAKPVTKPKAASLGPKVESRTVPKPEKSATLAAKVKENKPLVKKEAGDAKSVAKTSKPKKTIAKKQDD